MFIGLTFFLQPSEKSVSGAQVHVVGWSLLQPLLVRHVTHLDLVYGSGRQSCLKGKKILDQEVICELPVLKEF